MQKAKLDIDNLGYSKENFRILKAAFNKLNYSYDHLNHEYKNLNDKSKHLNDQYNSLKHKVKTQEEKTEQLTKKLNWFEEQFRLLKSKHYAKSSEKQNSLQLQLELFDENEEELQVARQETQQTEKITYERRKPNRADKNLDTSKLPREKHYIDLKAEEKQCSCGHCMDKIGEETHEELVFKPAELKVIEHIRIKYACRHCETVKAGQRVELPLSKSKAGAELLAEIMLNKYKYHLPFYRQSKMFRSYGLILPDNTIAGWVMKAAEQLEPLREAFWSQLSQVNVLQADETPVKVLHPEKKGYMWLYHCYLPGKRFVVFDFNLSRSSEVVNKRLKDFKGLLQTDGYSGYTLQRQRDDIISLGCWDHARRKFAEVIKACGNNKSGKAGQLLEKIAKLYEIEKEIKDLPFDKRKEIRQLKSKPKLALIKELVYKINAPPKSLLGIAVTYCKNQWSDLARYVDYGAAQISNCWIENQVRPFALGRRNWLFVGNEDSASKAGLIYSLIQSCELNDLDARLYLEYVLKQVHRMRRKELDPAMMLPNTIDKSCLKSSASVKV